MNSAAGGHGSGNPGGRNGKMGASQVPDSQHVEYPALCGHVGRLFRA